MFSNLDKGFSALEIVLAVAILALAAALVIFSFAGLRDGQLLSAGAEEIVSLLSLARGKTLSSEAQSQYGVYFESTRAVFFRGSSYPGVTEEEVVFDSLLQLSDISLVGGPSVVFERLTGVTQNTGQLTLSLVSDAAKKRVLQVNSTGLVELVGSDQ